ncbi:MAG: hypothetical protein M3134_03850 [Actinomycetota bacterium]|nr:hypothetical protein [Actinomycetota bacterium]
MRPPTYRQRLRREGTVLAISGALAAVLVVLVAEGATDHLVSTVVQVATLAALLGTLGVWSVRRSLLRAVAVEPGNEGSGEPTPLWLLPVIVAGLTLPFGLLVGWDAGLRVGAGCVVVGLAQAILFERLVAAEEARRGVSFVRIAGSSLFTGTNLGAVAAS